MIYYKGDGSHPMDKAISYGRIGFYGVVATGGSAMQWHPELQIGFAYIPGDLVKMDFSSFRSSQLQQKVVEITNVLQMHQK